MRLVIAICSVDYFGRLRAHLPVAKRLLMIKSDGSVLVHSDGGSYKPLNWMSPPVLLKQNPPSNIDSQQGIIAIWTVKNTKNSDRLVINIYEQILDVEHELGSDPGIVKDAVESQLQKLLSEQIYLLGKGFVLVKREYPTPIGPVDILAKNQIGEYFAVELKRRGDIDGVEQLTRYLDLLNRNPLLAPVKGIFAAQEIKPQARTLAQSRGIECFILDYEQMCGVDDSESRLF